ncbi:unnamed protein product [Caretta caretta]
MKALELDCGIPNHQRSVSARGAPPPHGISGSWLSPTLRSRLPDGEAEPEAARSLQRDLMPSDVSLL